MRSNRYTYMLDCTMYTYRLTVFTPNLQYLTIHRVWSGLQISYYRIRRGPRELERHYQVLLVFYSQLWQRGSGFGTHRHNLEQYHVNNLSDFSNVISQALLMSIEYSYYRRYSQKVPGIYFLRSRRRKIPSASVGATPWKGV